MYKSKFFQTKPVVITSINGKIKKLRNFLRSFLLQNNTLITHQRRDRQSRELPCSCGCRAF